MKRKHLFIILLATLIPWGAMAQKTHIANTSSSTQMTWAEFAQNVNNGYTYEGQTVYLDSDVTATTMAGTNETNCFKGTFEGQGHTLTFNYTASGSYYTAPFHYLNGATIQNLIVSGTITANYARCGGLAGNCYGTNAIINCLSNITINSTVNGDGTHGGFISRVYRGSTTFEGCTFAGSLLGGNTTANGGFVGWSEGNNNYASVSFSNCIYAPVANTTDPSAGATFARGRNNSTTGITISNCFYTSSEFQYTQGKQRYTITSQSPVTVAMSGTAINYNLSHITAYSGNQGLVYNGTIVAGPGDNVSLNLGGAFSYNADHGTITGSANPYTLSMEAYNTTISAISQPVSPTAPVLRTLATGNSSTAAAPTNGAGAPPPTTAKEPTASTSPTTAAPTIHTPLAAAPWCMPTRPSTSKRAFTISPTIGKQTVKTITISLGLPWCLNP